MEIPMYHNCQALSAENETLSIKYKKLTRKFKELQKTLFQLQGEVTKLRVNKENCDLMHSELLSNQQAKTVVHKPKSAVEDGTENKKMLQLHNNLLKRLEKESKISSNQLKKLNRMQTENKKLKDDLFSFEQQQEFYKNQLEDKNQQIHSLNDKLNSSISKPDDTKKYSLILREKKKLLSENKKLKDELKGLDNSFFEEIEDMKYALQQSSKLNVQYEQVIKKLCKQYGVSYNSLMGENVDVGGLKKSFKRRRRRSSTAKSR